MKRQTTLAKPATHIDFLIIGGGLAGATTARTLREEGASGRIMLVCEESIAPYQRPPLSKPRSLSADKTAHDIEPTWVLTSTLLDSLSIELMLNATAISLDRNKRLITLSNGQRLSYSKLLIATGASPTELDIPGNQLNGIHYLRTFEQSRELRQQAKSARHAVVIGGSFIGVEVAALLAKLGLSVTIIEARSLLYKLHSHALSKHFEGVLAKHGVRCLIPEKPLHITGRKKVSGVVTVTGEKISCDLVVIGVGVTPSTAFLADSGIACDDGVLVDQYLQTNDPHIYAAGDVANTEHPLFKHRLRMEHWDNAIKQGRIAARNMLGKHEPFTSLSYFFSHVFDQSFSLLGQPGPEDQTIERGSLESNGYELLYLQGDVATALLTLGSSSQNTRSAESLIQSHTNLHQFKDRLPDPSFSLSEIPGQVIYVLQGGGAYGAFEAGAVKALAEHNIAPDVVAGVSIGAFNGAVIAGNPDRAWQALASFWQDLSTTSANWLSERERRAWDSQQVMMFGVPGFFTPRWLNPWQNLGQAPAEWPSLYDLAPARDLLLKYVDFASLRSSPVRLLITAVDIQTSEVVLFDSYLQDLSVDHVLASGSLPPAFAGVTIEGRHYWDAGIVSNSPLEPTLARLGQAGKQIYLIDLFTGQRDELPATLADVYTRREEIIFSQRLRDDYAHQHRERDYQQLIQQLLTKVPEAAVRRIQQEPLYLQLMGQAKPTTTTRIIRANSAAHPTSKAYDFSRPTIQRLIQDGFDTATQVLKSST